MQVSTLENVKTGEVYDFHYSIKGFGKQAAIDNTAYSLDKDPRWTVVFASLQGNKAVFRIRIVKNPFPLAIVAGAIVAVAGGLFLWLSLDKVEKITESPSFSVVLLGGGALLAAMAFSKFKK